MKGESRKDDRSSSYWHVSIVELSSMVVKILFTGTSDQAFVFPL